MQAPEAEPPLSAELVSATPLAAFQAARLLSVVPSAIHFGAAVELS